MELRENLLTDADCDDDVLLLTNYGDEIGVTASVECWPRNATVPHRAPPPLPLPLPFAAALHWQLQAPVYFYSAANDTNTKQLVPRRSSRCQRADKIPVTCVIIGQMTTHG